MKLRYRVSIGLLGLMVCGILAQGAAVEEQIIPTRPGADRVTSSSRAHSAPIAKSPEAGSGYIGVGVASEEQDRGQLRKALGLDPAQPGALIIRVAPGSPAAKAGVHQGDLIITADRKAIKNYNDLIDQIADRTIGTTVTMSLLRPQEGGAPKRMNLKVGIARRPTHEELSRMAREKAFWPLPRHVVIDDQRLGISVEPDTQQGKRGLRILAIKQESLAERAGLAVGDLIMKINDVPLQTAQDVPKALEARPGKPALISYLRQGTPGLVAIELH